MIRELNIDNIVEFLNKQDPYTNRTNGFPNMVLYSSYSIGIVKYFYGDDYTLVDFKNLTNFKGSYCALKNDYIRKELYDTKRIQFVSLYPYITIKLFKEGKIKFNVKEYVNIYEYLVYNKHILKSNSNLSENGKTILNIIINLLFGVSTIYNIKKSCIIDYPNLVPDYLYEFLEKSFNKYDEIIYIDTDQIHLKELSIDFIKELDEFELPYEITTDINSMFLNKKRYVSQINGEIKLHGLSINRRSLSKPNSDHEIASIFEQKLKLLYRNKKINKLINGIK